MKKFRDTLHVIYRFFSSGRTAVVLIAVLTATVALGQIIPQNKCLDQIALMSFLRKHDYTYFIIRLLRLNNIYVSWVFILPLCLLFLNLVFCMGNRMKAMLEAGKDLGFRDYFFGGQRLSKWGSLVFHASFFVILAGVLASRLTRFEGTMILVEGQTLRERHEDYLSTSEAPLFRENHSLFHIRLNHVENEYNKGSLVKLTCDMTVEDGGRVEHRTVGVNRPLVYGNTAFLVHLFDFSPYIVIRDRRGEIVFQSHVNLVTEYGKREDRFAVPNTDLVIFARLFPDAVFTAGGLKTVSPEPKNPALQFRAVRMSKDGMFGKTLYEGHIFLKKSKSFDNYVLSFEDFRYWVKFNVRKDAGVPCIFAGLWIGTAGLALRFVAGMMLKESGSAV